MSVKILFYNKSIHFCGFLFLNLSSNAYSAPHASAGPDHVDYGAYTGGYGAFGWYTDHPVLLTGH